MHLALPDFSFGVLSVRALQPEEVALLAVLLLLLVDEVQPPVVEGLEPFLPADVPELVAVATEVEPQHAQVVAVLGAIDGGRHGATLLGPPTDDVVVGGGEAAPRTLGLVVGGGDLLGVLQGVRGALAGTAAGAPCGRLS